MLKKEFINVLQSKLGDCTKKQCEKIIDAFTESVEDVLVSGEEIKLVNFGTFKLKVINEHDGIDPKTREAIHYNARVTPYLKFSKKFKNNTALKNVVISSIKE